MIFPLFFFLYVIYKRVVARKIRLYFVYWINKINKRMKYLAGEQGVVSSVTSGCFDLVGRCCRVTLLGRPAIQLVCDLCLAYSYLPNFKHRHRPQKILLVEKNDWLKHWTFFSENFLGILERLCAEPMHRSHYFLSLTLAVVGSTSGSCYFLQ